MPIGSSKFIELTKTPAGLGLSLLHNEQQYIEMAVQLTHTWLVSYDLTNNQQYIEMAIQLERTNLVTDTVNNAQQYIELAIQLEPMD